MNFNGIIISMRLSQIYPFLSHLSLTPRQVARYNRMLSRGTVYASRLTAQERAVLIRLLREEEMLPGMSHVITEKIEHPKSSEFLPSLLFAVLAPDWAGLADACLGTVHEAGLNIAFSHSFILRRGKTKLGAVLIEIEITPDLTRQALDIARAKIQERLSRIAAEDEAKRTLQKQEARRLFSFTTVTDILRQRLPAEDLKEILGDSGEALKFFIARHESYLNERTPESLAEQIMTNFLLKRRIRQGLSTFELATHSIPYQEKKLTGLSIITNNSHITLERILRQLEEIFPGYRRYSDYAYFTADRISVFHLEITDRDDRPLAEADTAALRQALSTLSEVSETLGPTPGVELIRRKIVPPMLEEERELLIPQGYIHPHAPDHYKIIVVASGDDAGFGLEIVKALSREPGFSAAKPDMPSYVSYTKDGREVQQEIAIIDLWVDKRLLFGPDQGRWNEEDIYSRIEALIRTIPGFGAKLRIFDRTSRALRQLRLKAVLKLAEEGGLDPKLVRPIFYSLGDRCLINPSLSDAAVLSQIALCCRAQSRFDQKEAASLVWDNLRLDEEDRESTFLAAAVPCQPQAVVSLLESLKGLEINFICRTDLDRLTLLLINLNQNGRPLSQEKMDRLSQEIKKSISGRS